MAGKHYIQTMTMAADSTQTSGIQVFSGEPTVFTLYIPGPENWCITSTVNVRLLGSTDGENYANVAFSQNPATGTSETIRYWETPQTAATAWFICEAAQCFPYVKVQYTNTATAQTEVVLCGKIIY